MPRLTRSGETQLSWILREFASQIPSGMLDRTISANRLVEQTEYAYSPAYRAVASAADRHWVQLRDACECARSLGSDANTDNLASAIESSVGVTFRCAMGYANALRNIPVIYANIIPCHRYK